MASVLVIEDSEVLRASIVGVLRQHGLFEAYYEAEDGLSGLKILLDSRPDLVLCDVEMPRMDGFRFLSMVAMRDEVRDTPVILLTGLEDRESKIRGLELGAVDYVTKPFDPGELVARVRVQLKILALQEELRRSNDLLKELSITDHLTGLYNRRHLTEALQREFKRAERTGSPLSFIMLDIDHFKKINDRYGHQDGDRVLAMLGQLVQRALRSYDIAARYGGEEFALVLPEAAHGDALEVAERLRRDCQGLLFDGRLQGLMLTISLGVCTYPGSGVDSVDSLVRQADEALYRAKSAGRNRVDSAVG